MTCPCKERNNLNNLAKCGLFLENEQSHEMGEDERTFPKSVLKLEGAECSPEKESLLKMEEDCRISEWAAGLEEVSQEFV